MTDRSRRHRSTRYPGIYIRDGVLCYRFWNEPWKLKRVRFGPGSSKAAHLARVEALERVALIRAGQRNLRRVMSREEFTAPPERRAFYLLAGTTGLYWRKPARSPCDPNGPIPARMRRCHSSTACETLSSGSGPAPGRCPASACSARSRCERCGRATSRVRESSAPPTADPSATPRSLETSSGSLLSAGGCSTRVPAAPLQHTYGAACRLRCASGSCATAAGAHRDHLRRRRHGRPAPP